MADITSLDFRKLLAKTTNDIFDTMLSMRVETNNKTFEIIKDNNRIVGSVGFDGDVTGCMNIHVGDAFAKLITAAMLGEDPGEVEKEDILDVVGELSNMIGGTIKSRLCDVGMPCSLTTPTAMSGDDFIIESQGWLVHESMAFHSDDHVAFVEVYVKSNKSI